MNNLTWLTCGVQRRSWLSRSHGPLGPLQAPLDRWRRPSTRKNRRRAGRSTSCQTTGPFQASPLNGADRRGMAAPSKTPPVSSPWVGLRLVAGPDSEGDRPLPDGRGSVCLGEGPWALTCVRGSDSLIAGQRFCRLLKTAQSNRPGRRDESRRGTLRACATTAMFVALIRSPRALWSERERS